MRAFRLLREDEIECRIAEINKQGSGLSLLLYKTARTDAALLDETFGADRWQNDYKILDGKLYGGIGIKFENGWISDVFVPPFVSIFIMNSDINPAFSCSSIS